MYISRQQQSTSGEDRDTMARMERKVKKAEEVMAAAERSQVYVSLSLSPLSLSLFTSYRERGRENNSNLIKTC